MELGFMLDNFSLTSSYENVKITYEKQFCDIGWYSLVT